VVLLSCCSISDEEEAAAVCSSSVVFRCASCIQLPAVSGEIKRVSVVWRVKTSRTGRSRRTGGTAVVEQADPPHVRVRHPGPLAHVTGVHQGLDGGPPVGREVVTDAQKQKFTPPSAASRERSGGGSLPSVVHDGAHVVAEAKGRAGLLLEVNLHP